VSHFSFESFWQQKELPDDYFAQLTIYTRALSRDLPDLKRHILLVKNKNTAGFLEYLSEYDHAADRLTVQRMTRHTGEVIDLGIVYERIVEQAIEKFRQVEDHAISGTLPARPYESDHWRCRYCLFRETCWENYSAEVKSNAVKEVVPLDGEDAARVQQYYALQRSIKEIERQKDELNKALVDALLGRGITKAVAGDLKINVSVIERSTIAWDDVPIELVRKLDAYKKKSPSTMLRISAPAQNAKE
jgi:hypothetical protein